jgi:putative two-component system response regulator
MTADGTRMVMVVEDDDDIRESLVELLEGWGLHPLPVQGAARALQLLEDGCQPAVILLDLRMPGMTGWEFRRAQMSESRFATIPVVVMTALGGNQDPIKAQMGDVVWLPKPFARAQSKRPAVHRP